jgi:hypothetical protein
MRVLVGCECSGVVREAFRALRHDAWSCDLKPAEDGSPFHIQGDVLDHLADGWDLGIFHPVCRYLTNSGAKHLYLGMRKENGINPDRWAKMEAGAAFFLKLLNSPIPKVAVENPIMHRHAKAIIGVQQTQIVQPWMFGHLETKATCLWLRGLPPLEPTNNVYDAMMALPIAERARVHHMPPGPNREADRSRTLPGIGAAMARFWGDNTGHNRETDTEIQAITLRAAA